MLNAAASEQQNNLIGCVDQKQQQLFRKLIYNFRISDNASNHRFKERLLTPHGSGFSITPMLMQSAGFRFPNRACDLHNLYFVGAGTHPGAGVPGVVTSAKVVERLIFGNVQ